MHQSDELLDIERQSVGKDLWVLADAIPYRKTFRTELRKRLIVQAWTFDTEKAVRTLGATSRDKGEAQAHPSLSWSQTWLQRLSQGVGRFSERRLATRKALVLAGITVLVIAISTAALVPSVRAQLGKIIAAPARFSFRFWTRSGTVSGTITVALFEDFTEFTPLYLTYLPAGLSSSPTLRTRLSNQSELEFLEMTYHNDDQFLVVAQTKAPADRALPAGREVTVSDQPAALVSGLRGEFVSHSIRRDDEEETASTILIESVRYRVSIDYTSGKRLTWYVGDAKVEMLSNLSEKEMLKIAESLAPEEQERRDLRWRLSLPRLSVELLPIESDP